MTDNEIIKALECCSDECNCKDCPCSDKRFEPDISCAEELMKTAAELIKKQKTILETLKQKAIDEISSMLKEKTMNLCANELLLVRKKDVADIVHKLTPQKETSVSLIDGHIEGSDD